MAFAPLLLFKILDLTIDRGPGKAVVKVKFLLKVIFLMVLAQSTGLSTDQNQADSSMKMKPDPFEDLEIHGDSSYLSLEKYPRIDPGGFRNIKWGTTKDRVFNIGNRSVVTSFACPHQL
jgi:hypothetical protein